MGLARDVWHIESLNGQHALDYSQKIGLGSKVEPDVHSLFGIVLKNLEVAQSE